MFFCPDTSRNGSKLPLFFAPSISPLYFQNLGGFLPRIRFFNYSLSTPDASTLLSPALEILDFRQYYVNISSNVQPSWSLEYMASKTYNLPSLSESKLKDLLDQFESNQELWGLYWNHELGVGMSHDSGPCPEVRSFRHCRHMCSLRHLHFPPLDECLSKCEKIGDSIVASPRSKNDQKLEDNWNAMPVIVLVIVAFLAILIGVVFLANRELCHRKSRSRRFRRRMELIEEKYRRSETCLIGCHQPDLTGVAMRCSTLDEDGLRLQDGFGSEELKALNVEEVKDSAYDADASGDEDDIPRVSMGKEDNYPVNGSQRQGLVRPHSLPLNSPQQ